MSNSDISDGDIVDALRDMAFIIDEVNKSGVADVKMLSGDMFLEAAQKIEELTRLGDSLVDVMRSGSDCGWDKAIDAWEEARHV